MFAWSSMSQLVDKVMSVIRAANQSDVISAHT